MAALRAGRFDLVLSDMDMEDGTGLDLARQAMQAYPSTGFVMVTRIEDLETAREAIRIGAYGYITKPFREHDIIANVMTALRRRELEVQRRFDEEILEEELTRRTAALRSSREELALRLIAASEYRDNETGAHIRRIGLYSAALARRLGWSASEVETIRLAGPMHDIGKIGIPDRILQKPGKLSAGEWKLMQQHTTIGAKILAGSANEQLELARTVALYHHEKWDGSGYPHGLAGEEIPLPARIVAVVDVYDALTHARCYKPAWPEVKAVRELQDGRGRHFDPALVNVFLASLNEMRAIRLENPDNSAPEIRGAMFVSAARTESRGSM